VFKARFLVAVLFFGVAVVPLPPNASALTDSERQKSFLQTQDKSTPSPRVAKKKGKKSKAKPKPASKKKRLRPASEEQASQTEHEPIKKPTPAPEPSHSPAAPSASPVTGNSVVVEKSAVLEEEPAPTPPPEKGRWWWPFGSSGHKYKYLTRAVRDAIDDAPVPRHQWRYIVVHNSGTQQGNAKAFDYYHLHVRKMPNGLAYHFVIGNGTSSGNGAVEIGPRWVRQINGGHVHSDYLNSIALGICLVGDYNRDKPTREQLEALDELIQYLRRRVGKTDRKLAIVKAHRDINPPQWPTDCPGDRFPYGWLSSKFD